MDMGFALAIQCSPIVPKRAAMSIIYLGNIGCSPYDYITMYPNMQHRPNQITVHSTGLWLRNLNYVAIIRKPYFYCMYIDTYICMYIMAT